MANAKKDDNMVNTMIGVLNTDGVTPIRIRANPTTRQLLVRDGTTGTSFGQSNAERDDNRVPVLMAVSSADGTTPVPLYVNSDGELMIKST